MARRKQKPGRPLTLSSLRQVKALAHPLRFRLFERLIDEPRTGKQLADMLGSRPTQLYHHLRVLERSGLIRQVATRRKRGTTEKYFQAVSDRVALDRKLFGGRVEAGGALLGQVLRTTLDELLEVARRRRGEPFALDPVGIELVETVLRTPFRALLASEDQWHEMNGQIDRTL